MKNMHRGLLLVAAAVLFLTACATMQGRWEATTSEGTIAAYEGFLEEYPEGDLADQARRRRNELYEERAWSEAAAANTVRAYQDFVKYHPKGKYAGEASARIERLAPPRRVEWLPNTEKILERYRQGVFTAEASSALEKKVFAEAEAAETIAAYGEYLNQYPRGVFADEARSRQEKLRFRQAEAADTAAAYGAYLNQYPQGVFAAEARARREKRMAAGVPAATWGTVMYPKSNANIRAGRSVTSPLKGRLKNGQPVRADFLRDGWYAVFPLTQKQRDEKRALGYVHAPLLTEKRDPGASGPEAAGEKSANVVQSKKTERDNLPVGVKNVGFKAARDGKEMLLIEFDRFYKPMVFGIEGKEPLIILEIGNVSPLREAWAAIDTGGHFILQIRSSMDTESRAALVVLSMAPDKEYSVNQVFYNKENLYALEISEKKQPPLPGRP